MTPTDTNVHNHAYRLGAIKHPEFPATRQGAVEGGVEVRRGVFQAVECWHGLVHETQKTRNVD